MGDFGVISWSDTIAEVKTPRFYRDVFCEATISFVLLFVDTMMAAQANTLLAPLSIGIVCGLYVFLLIEAFGHVQGALQNPIVTLSFVCTKRLSVIKGICYILAQIAGGTAGAALSKATMTREQAAVVSAFSPGAGVEAWQALVADSVITAGLIVVTLGALDERLRTVTMPGFPIGLALSFGIISGGPISGGVMNPCIATSFANVSKDWGNLWIYWVGDYLGGIVAIFFYWFYTYDGGVFKSQELTQSEEKGGRLDETVRL